MKKQNLGFDSIITLNEKDLQELSLFDDIFLTYATDGNIDFIDFLIKAALNFLKITDYEIESVSTEVFEGHLNFHGVRIDILVKLKDGRQILIEVQNLHPEEMSPERIIFEIASHIVKSLEKGKPYTDLSDFIFICYSKEPLPWIDNKKPVNIFELKNVVKDEETPFGLYIFIINGKYKDENFKDFQEVISELKKTKIDDIKNPIIKAIHKEVKETRKGKLKLEGIFQKYNKDILDELDKLIKKVEQVERESEKNKRENEQNKLENERNKRENEQNKKEIQLKDQEILRLKAIIKENNLSY